MNKAFIYTLDAALALIPIFIILSSLSSIPSWNPHGVARFSATKQIADDTLLVMDWNNTLYNASLLIDAGNVSIARTNIESLANNTIFSHLNHSLWTRSSENTTWIFLSGSPTISGKDVAVATRVINRVAYKGLVVEVGAYASDSTINYTDPGTNSEEDFDLDDTNDFPIQVVCWAYYWDGSQVDPDNTTAELDIVTFNETAIISAWEATDGTQYSGNISQVNASSYVTVIDTQPMTRTFFQSVNDTSMPLGQKWMLAYKFNITTAIANSWGGDGPYEIDCNVDDNQGINGTDTTNLLIYDSSLSTEGDFEELNDNNVEVYRVNFGDTTEVLNKDNSAGKNSPCIENGDGWVDVAEDNEICVVLNAGHTISFHFPNIELQASATDCSYIAHVWYNHYTSYGHPQVDIDPLFDLNMLIEDNLNNTNRSDNTPDGQPDFLICPDDPSQTVIMNHTVDISDSSGAFDNHMLREVGNDNWDKGTKLLNWWVDTTEVFVAPSLKAQASNYVYRLYLWED